MNSEKLDSIISLLTEIRDELRRKKRSPTQAKPHELEDGLPRIAAIWNQYKDEKFPAAREFSPASTRWKSCLARWAEKPREEYWRDVVMRMNRSSFCKGANDRKWIASIDFLIRPDTPAKVLEGKYDDKEPKKVKTVLEQEFNPETGELVIRQRQLPDSY